MSSIIQNSLAVIPARAGSKSVKNKNLRIFHNKPLIAWTIEQAIASKVSRVVVTTNSEEIRDVAIEYGAEVPYLRSEELSNDTMAIEPVIIISIISTRFKPVFSQKSEAISRSFSLI